jgi:hypothetical protein
LCSKPTSNVQGGEDDRGFADGFSPDESGLTAGAPAVRAGCWIAGDGVEGWISTTGAWGTHWVISVVMAVVSEPNAIARVA